ncbi:ribosome maturation factor RimM [Alkalilimnicola sp. S0819]|uniref:ribosome maturation factor RimM n=1 Tax=Alkalilimnicola sp. S0819 TaxID=2613922 RepID=UPI0012621B07|nr:ribosome maturation factor RimM [Alkalilimnicola sp. S0819]KAB7622565.1 ribosome maturation factor RimM [Alkalilimnicola sp. S0819]MPQ17452.1 ribosome maturation factor RimM [Alkalilimnicola sp. S0819]
MEDRRWLTLGRISGLYGVRGWVKVHSYTDPRENLLDYPQWWIQLRGEEQRIELEQGRPQGKTLVVKLQGVDDREQARLYMGVDIRVPREQLPAAAADEYYWTDLEGLRVLTVDGQDLGRVDHLIETGANDVLVVRGERERLIPFLLDQVVKRVDLQAGRLEVDWDPEF